MNYFWFLPRGDSTLWRTQGAATLSTIAGSLKQAPSQMALQARTAQCAICPQLPRGSGAGKEPSPGSRSRPSYAVPGDLSSSSGVVPSPLARGLAEQGSRGVFAGSVN